jgi:hypothetical protein
MLRLVAPLCVLLMCLLLVNNASGEQKKKKKKGQNLQGVVLKVETATGATDEGTLTIMTGAKKKKNTAGKEMSIQVKKSTKIERAAGKKMPPTAASFADLQAGQRVSIKPSSDRSVADRVVILKGKKKTNN